MKNVNLSCPETNQAVARSSFYSTRTTPYKYHLFFKKQSSAICGFCSHSNYWILEQKRKFGIFMTIGMFSGKNILIQDRR